MTIKHTFSATIDQLPLMMQRICNQARALQFSPLEVSHIELAVEEVLINIITHGYKKKKEECYIDITCPKNEDSTFALIIEDRGVPFDPVRASKKCPAAEQKPDIDKAILNGYGLFLIFQMMDKVDYWYEDGKNVLSLTKYKKLG